MATPRFGLGDAAASSVVGTAPRMGLKLGPRVLLQVEYLTSGQYTTCATAVHFFQTVEGKERLTNRLKRVVILLDKETFAADFERQIQRLQQVSQVRELGLFEEHLRPLQGPMTQYDLLLQNTSVLDIVRLLPCSFSPRDAANRVAMYELEEGQPLAPLVNCRPGTLGEDDGVVMRMQHEEVVRRIRDTHQLETNRLRELMQSNKDSQLLELLDAKTEIDRLRHSLSLAESSQHAFPPSAAGAAAGPKLPYESVEPPRAPPLPAEPPPIPQPPSPTGAGHPQHSSYSLYAPAEPVSAPSTPVGRGGGGGGPGAGSGAWDTRRAGRLVDALSTELQENAAYLDGLYRRGSGGPPGGHPPPRDVSPVRASRGGPGSGGGTPRGGHRVTPRRASTRAPTAAAEAAAQRRAAGDYGAAPSPRYARPSSPTQNRRGGGPQGPQWR